VGVQSYMRHTLLKEKRLYLSVLLIFYSKLAFVASARFGYFFMLLLGTESCFLA